MRNGAKAAGSVTDTERRHGIVRENSLAYAIQTAVPGDDPMAIIARAQLFEEYVLGAEARLTGVHVDFDKPPLNPG